MVRQLLWSIFPPQTVLKGPTRHVPSPSRTKIIVLLPLVVKMVAAGRATPFSYEQE